MLQKRKSRFREPTGEDVRLRKTDFTIFELYGPGKLKQFDRLTADLIALLTDRWKARDRVNTRCGQLFDAKYLKRYNPPAAPGEGSKKVVNLLTTKGANALKEHLIGEANRKVQAGELTLQEANTWVEIIEQETKSIKNFNPREYHQDTEHSVTTNWFRALVQGACRQRDDIELLYQYPDHSLGFRLGHRQLKGEVFIDPDTFHGWRLINQPPETGVNNFYVEVHRSSRKTKQTKDERKRTIERRLKDYRNFKYFQLYQGIQDNCPEVENWKNMRVLWLTETGPIEHENLIKLTRDTVGRDGKSLGLFWFAKKSDFDLASPESLFAPVWRTALDKDEPRSLLD